MVKEQISVRRSVHMGTWVPPVSCHVVPISSRMVPVRRRPPPDQAVTLDCTNPHRKTPCWEETQLPA